MKHKTIQTVEALVKAASNIDDSSRAILVESWRKKASVYEQDFEVLKRNHQDFEADRLYALAATYKQAAEQLKETIKCAKTKEKLSRVSAPSMQ